MSDEETQQTHTIHQGSISGTRSRGLNRGRAFDPSSVSRVHTADIKVGQLSDARTDQIVEDFFVQCGATSESNQAELMANLGKYLWVNTCSRYLVHPSLKWGTAFGPLPHFLRLKPYETMRQFGRSRMMNAVAYHLAQNNENKEWIDAFARKRGIEGEKARYAFDYYNPNVYPEPDTEPEGSVVRGAKTAIRTATVGDHSGEESRSGSTGARAFTNESTF